MPKVNLLDCTLRDGGYVNDWRFGHENIVNIFERLVSARVDIIEVGFLDERRPYDPDRSIFPDTESANRTYGSLDKGSTMTVAMIDIGTCGIEHIQPASQTCIDGIRVIFKKAKIPQAMEFCGQLKELGYKVFANAVSITSYDDTEYRALLDEVNKLEPFTFSIVDTYGLLHRQDVDYYYKTADECLKESIGIGYHAHNNFQLAYSNCIEAMETPGRHMLTVDGSLYAIGKSAGNAALELLAQYMNEYLDKHYDINQILEAIDVTIMDIYRRTPWGYTFKFYISALNDCHPNYVTYLMEKKKLSIKSINDILGQLQGDKKLLYDADLIERLYQEYQDVDCDDAADRERLAKAVAGRNILLLAPGNNVYDQRERVDAYIAANDPLIISVGFIPRDYNLDFLFLSNSKRYVQLSSYLSRCTCDLPVIATSNVTRTSGRFDYTLRYAPLLDELAELVDNPLIMLLKLFSTMEPASIALAGFDGYTTREASDYVNPNMEYVFSKEKALEINADARASLKRLGKAADVVFVTDSLYQE